MNRKKRIKKAPINFRKFLIGAISLLILSAFVLMYVFRKPPDASFQSKKSSQKTESRSMDFTIEGRLAFTKANGDTITSISIEIADDNYSRQMGMMYRYYIPDTVGMLFIFPGEQQRGFWMKNTPSSLDIMYANANKRIVRIWENTLPYSEESIPSGDPAKYVIEVVAGFCSKHGITEGDKFSYISY